MLLETTEISPKLHLRREDLSHPFYGGNKLRKLKYNLLKARAEGHDTILTFGGAWSNHIYATAAACKEHNVKSIGVIRGEEPQQYSTTLQFARDQGMKLHFVSRSEYREKDEDFFKAWLRDVHGRFYLVPEGGSNFLGVQGCMEILSWADKQHYTHIAVSAGTGATAAGLLLSAAPTQHVLAFPALKDPDYIRDQISRHVHSVLMDAECTAERMTRLQVISGYEEGGYARLSDRLLEFMRHFRNDHHIELDAVYTGKMMMGLTNELRGTTFGECPNILAIHTGGLQGNNGLMSW